MVPVQVFRRVRLADALHHRDHPGARVHVVARRVGRGVLVSESGVEFAPREDDEVSYPVTIATGAINGEAIGREFKSA
jgi:hypothetical protein